MSSSIDIANLVEFLTSDKSLFITGCIIPVDGGARLRSQEQVIKQFIKI
jgi:NAD(P)-dependent dehydrogenase (short-subunit alcohol dehydrogenase family)